MASLIEQLPSRIAELEAKFGSDNPYVVQLKEQLRASIATQGKSTQDVFRMQAFEFPTNSSSGDLSDKTEESSE
jgi:hypothetical protein